MRSLDKRTLKFISLSILLILFAFVSVRAQESLIPLPTHVQWSEGTLDLSKGIQLETNHTDLVNERVLVEDILTSWQIEHSTTETQNKLPVLQLKLISSRSDKSSEAYQLKIDDDGISIAASTPTGIFYGLQTLRQFNIQNKQIRKVTIADQPAFSWRAFLLDVGRNYQPMDMLKEQIDILSRYKMNVLHFHFTEDIAWRLASKKYPGLTAADNMTRWEGKYYTQEQFQELIDYCAERHILFLPEIDMPGHSAAFKRFFGVDMQSDSGIVYIKELLKEFSETFANLPYLHIGGDEVKITNNDFMPEITRYVESLGYKTVGWDPGSNLMPQTIRQLWMGGAEKIEESGEKMFIDSKHLYINHMDPLETVTTLFHRKIGEQGDEHANLIGATLCSWPDRAVSKPIDMFYQSSIYPAILTFAERSWRGGGKTGWVANIVPKNSPDYQEFRDFERRLLVHKDLYFNNKPFPYVKQTDLVWDLIGPFDNNGDLSKSFISEDHPYSNEIKVTQTAEGGTIILRHWWADVIKGALKQPEENTTWYARTKIWSNKNELVPFWIGFNDLSRSYASHSPQKGTWDEQQSEVWVNGLVISPPDWKQGGEKGALETPLIDESYSYREPTMIRLNKGWNEVLVKLPVGEFKGKSWDSPVKWMFTFIPYK